MTTYDLTYKQKGVTGPKKIYLGGNNESALNRLKHLEDKVAAQTNKLDQIAVMLNELSKTKLTS